MRRIEFEAPARADLIDIFLFGMDRFGETQAEIYRDSLMGHLDNLASDPFRYPAIPLGCRRSVFRSHSILYEVEAEVIVILRILGRQDLTAALKRR